MSRTCSTGKGTSNKLAQGHGRWEPKEPLHIATKEVAQKGWEVYLLGEGVATSLAMYNVQPF